MKAVGALCKLPLHPHLFRHYFGTTLHQAGASVPEVMSLMGHRDLRSQAVYLHANMERQKAAIERYGNILSGKAERPC
jgi:integrase